MELKSLKISARKSDLARYQAYRVGQALQQKFPSLEIQYSFRESLGDKNQNDPLYKMPEKGVFTEDFYQDLVRGETDMVVHSWKDLPTFEKSETMIAGTLPRADQRDLLLFKKAHQGKDQLRIFSSSPRRAYNLSSFLKDVLPWQPQEVSLEPVRGNIPTRIKKLNEQQEISGLILAKAALDRLLSAPESEFQETQNFIRQSLADLNWMVLPLSENPNAAAQGALAIEIHKNRKDLAEVLKSINCPKTFQAAESERRMLRQYGGGCHLAIGVAVLYRDYGSILFLRGKTEDGKILESQHLRADRHAPSGLQKKILKFKEERDEKESSMDLSGKNVFVSRAEAWPQSAGQTNLVWSAGIKTWKKLAQKGVWVHGSAEGLGEKEDARLQDLVGPEIRWTRLTHSQADGLAQYDLKLAVEDSFDAKKASDMYFYWKSFSKFQAALKVYPELKKSYHACGPGKTFDEVVKVLGSQDKVFIWLNESDFLKD